MHFTVQQILGILRIVMGWIFLWGFMDKVWGLGFTTAADKSWLSGTSPTEGFLAFATKGPFVGLYHSLAGSVLVDWLFMLGLLLMGVALILGIGVKIAGHAGALLMFFMWTSLLPPEHNPIVDEHIVQLLVLLAVAHGNAGHTFGLGHMWSKTTLVKKCPVLE